MIATVNHRISRLGCHVSTLLRTARFSSTQFVPEHDPVQEEDIQKLEKFLSDKPNILVLTGAGISTESGE